MKLHINKLNLDLVFTIRCSGFMGCCVLSPGLFMGSCGEKTIRFRPSLVFKEFHVHQLLNILNDVLAEHK